MLKKYSLFYRKQFKKRRVYNNVNFYCYILNYNYFYWKKPIVFVKGFAQKCYILKLTFYVRLFRLIRKRFNSRRVIFFTNMHVNKMLTQKHKNSRMGKGVGKRYKWVFHIFPYHPIFIVYNIQYTRLQWISNFLWNHSKIKLIWVNNTVYF